MAVDHATDIRRTITGLVLAAIVVLALVLRGWVLLALILLVAALGLWEFFSLFWGNKRIPSRVCAIALGWGMLTLTWAHRTQDALVCLGAGFVLAAMSFLFRWNEVEEEGVPAFAASGIFMAGLAYIPLLLLPPIFPPPSSSSCWRPWPSPIRPPISWAPASGTTSCGPA